MSDTTVKSSFITRMVQNARRDNEETPMTPYEIAKQKRARQRLIARSTACVVTVVAVVAAVKYCAVQVPKNQADITAEDENTNN